MSHLPDEAVAAIERGNLLEAVRHVHARTGLGLKASKEAVDRYRQGDRSPLANGVVTDAEGAFDDAFASASGPLPPAAMAALARGRKVEAVKLVRAATGLGLADAKRLVEAQGAIPSPQTDGMDALRSDPMAEPGRVRVGPLGRPLLWIVMALVVLIVWSVWGHA